VLKIVGKLWAVGAPPRTALGSSQRSFRLPAGGEGLLLPAQEPHPRSRPSVLPRPPMKYLWHALGARTRCRWVYYCTSTLAPPAPVVMSFTPCTGTLTLNRNHKHNLNPNPNANRRHDHRWGRWSDRPHRLPIRTINE